MMNDVFDFFVQMIVVDDVYVFSLMMMMIDDVYPNDLYYYPVMMIRMKLIPTSIVVVVVDDVSMMYHENLFDVDYYVYNNENLLKTT